MPASFVYDAVRTPFGRAGGALSSVRPDDLAAVVMRSIVERTGIDPARIDDVIFGDANQAGEDNRNVARFGALLAGFPSIGARGDREPPVRLVGRGRDPGIARDRVGGCRHHPRRRRRVDEPGAVRRGEVGEAVPRRRQPDHVEHLDRVADDQPRAAQGLDDLERRVGREARRDLRHLARRAGRVRAAQPQLAAPAGLRAPTTTRSCRSTVTSSRGTKASAIDTTLEKLGGLKALFAADGSVTAGNSSSINDGASALLLGGEGVLDAEPLARIAGRGVFGNDPDVFGVAPVEAANRALARAGQDLGRCRRRRAQRGLRVAEPRVPAAVARARPREGQHPRRRDRDRPPARSLGRPHHRPRRARTRPPRRRGRGRRDLHRRRPGPRGRPGAVSRAATRSAGIDGSAIGRACRTQAESRRGRRSPACRGFRREPA